MFSKLGDVVISVRVNIQEEVDRCKTEHLYRQRNEAEKRLADINEEIRKHLAVTALAD